MEILLTKVVSMVTVSVSRGMNRVSSYKGWNSLCWMFNAAILGRDKVRHKRVAERESRSDWSAPVLVQSWHKSLHWINIVEFCFCGPTFNLETNVRTNEKIPHCQLKQALIANETAHLECFFSVSALRPFSIFSLEVVTARFPNTKRNQIQKSFNSFLNVKCHFSNHFYESCVRILDDSIVMFFVFEICPLRQMQFFLYVCSY